MDIDRRSGRYRCGRLSVDHRQDERHHQPRGEKIAPSEVERALSLHPAVHEALAFSVPHPRLGESVSAAVVLKSETEATSAELQSFLFDRVASSKIPQHIYIVASLPRTQTGKVHVSELKKQILDRANEIIRQREISKS